MKSVLISIQPKWCELIASGKKTVEVRKTRPKIDVPFKVYIYCTKDEPLYHSGEKFWCEKAGEFGNGKVIGEFVCDEIYDCRDVNMDDTCITVEEWLKYTKGHKGVVYGWHISDLVIYDKPRELSEFRKECKLKCDMRSLNEPPCEKCEHLVKSFGCGRTITRPPQSWCYVESEGDPFCDAYCGVACVDGSCPKIENKQYRCVDCWLYKGCKDCCFYGDIDFCPHAGESEVQGE